MGGQPEHRDVRPFREVSSPSLLLHDGSGRTMSSDRVLEVAGDPAPPSPSAVRDQLDRMLRRAAFRSAPRMQDLLRYVVTEALAGHSYRINERTIAVEALTRIGTAEALRAVMRHLKAARWCPMTNNRSLF